MYAIRSYYDVGLRPHEHHHRRRAADQGSPDRVGAGYVTKQAPVVTLVWVQQEGNVVRLQLPLRGANPGPKRVLGNVAAHRGKVRQRVIARCIHGQPQKP